MSNKKVLFVHDHKIMKRDGMLYSRGGLTSALIEKYERFFGELSICSREIPFDPQKSIQLADRKINHIRFPDMLRREGQSIRDALSQLSEEIGKSDIIIIRLPSISGLIAYYMAKRQGKNYFVEVVGCPFDALWSYGNIKGKVLAPIFYLANKFAIKHAKNVLYVSEKFLQSRYPSRGNNIVGCSDVEVDIQEKSLVQRKEKISNHLLEKITLGMIGNIATSYKGYDCALAALSLLERQSSGKYHLEIVGSGDPSYLNGLIKQFGLEQNVNLLGTKQHPHGVNEWLDNIDIYLQPSRQEGLPRALVEAISRACPCIGSTTGGIPELIDDNYVIAKGDHLALADKIKCLSNKDKMQETAVKNFEVSKAYDNKILKQKRDKFYQQVLAGQCA